MSRPAKMKKINIFALEEDIYHITEELGRLGVLQIEEEDLSEKWEIKNKRWKTEAEEYRNEERQLQQIVTDLGIAEKGKKSYPGADSVEKPEEIAKVVEEVNAALMDWKKRREELSQKIKNLQLLKKDTEAISSLDVSLEKLTHLEHIYLVIGRIPTEDLNRLKMALFRIPFVIIPFHEYEEWTLILAASAEEDKAVLDRALKSALFYPFELPENISGFPEDVVGKLDSQLMDAQKEQAKLEKEKKKLVDKYGDQVLTLWNHGSYQASVLETIAKFGQNGEMYLITGWVPEKNLDELVDTVKNSTNKRVDLEVLEPGKKK